ncbi:MAG: AAA family ATPase [Chloroflexi bacterium]|nr:AAA family ATPase [Chloroflexota bacterium]
MTTSPHTTPEATDRERRDLFDVLPPSIRKAIEGQPDPEDLLEVVLDLGRPPQARFAGKDIHLGCADVSRDDLDHVTARVGDFGDDNRAGIERTLHRISAIRNRRGEVIGLTCRVGRAVHGSARVIEDLALSGKSILLVGRPGVGKTTILRELARVLADASKRVIIVDTSNEIAGDGDIPHPAIGRARRMQVATPSRQHAVMIEAVENHMPQVIIVDEMGTELEAIAARTIAERGVQLVATAHGNTLENLLVNPTLSDLVGGVQTVTLGDEEARRRRTQKTILERKAPPTFDVLVEIQSWNSVAVHADVAKTVDAVLRGRTVTPETRELDESGTVRRSYQRAAAPPEFEVAPFIYGQERERRYGPEREHRPRRYEHISYEQDFAPSPPAKPAMRVHPFGVSRERLQQSAGGAGLAVKVADSLSDADVVLTTKAHYRRRASVLVAAEEQGVPVYVLRRNTPGQIVGFIEQLTETDDDGGSHHSGAAEAEEGVQRILAGEASTIELRPQSSFVRRIQHRIAEQAQLRSHSVGREPRRRVTIRRTQ